MNLHVGAILVYIGWAEDFERERLTMLTWNHDAFRRVLRDNKLERVYLRAARQAAMKGLPEFVEAVYLHDRQRGRVGRAAALLLRSDRERYYQLRTRRRTGA